MEATARASSVLPVPGGPNSSTPFHGSLIPTKNSGISSGRVTASFRSSFADFRLAMSSKVMGFEISSISSSIARTKCMSAPLKRPTARGTAAPVPVSTDMDSHSSLDLQTPRPSIGTRPVVSEPEDRSQSSRMATSSATASPSRVKLSVSSPCDGSTLHSTHRSWYTPGRNSRQPKVCQALALPEVPSPTSTTPTENDRSLASAAKVTASILPSWSRPDRLKSNRWKPGLCPLAGAAWAHLNRASTRSWPQSLPPHSASCPCRSSPSPGLYPTTQSCLELPKDSRKPQVPAAGCGAGPQSKLPAALPATLAQIDCDAPRRCEAEVSPPRDDDLSSSKLVLPRRLFTASSTALPTSSLAYLALTFLLWPCVPAPVTLGRRERKGKRTVSAQQGQDNRPGERSPTYPYALLKVKDLTFVFWQEGCLPS
mmetsp:Transcript_10548/g.36435  ORF Transcript_10548/g.36435 Transcript_10548/m.36435 type:complete len:426 (-) Transcript_10548:310-1587(-)